MKFTEKSLVEDYIVEKLMEKRWRFVPANELGRDTLEEPLLIRNLIRAIKKINQEKGIGDEEINRVVNELKLTPTGQEGAKRILNFFKLGVPVKFEREKVVNYVRLFDFRDIDQNEFIVTRQAHYQGKERIRTDIILYINGIPLVNIECKNPTGVSESWTTAYGQIKRYEADVPELYKYIQIGIAAESVARYFPIVPWQRPEEIKTHEWREEGVDSINSTLVMLSREILLDIIKDYIFYRIEMGNATKVITRYMQYRAANKMANRVVGNLKGEDDKDKGLIWHWQGSGKTLTMIFAANILFFRRELENPTIIFIVDRIELKDQLYDEFNALDIVEPEIIKSIPELKDFLKYEDYRGKRGIFIVLIHKFRHEELKELQGELEELSVRKETIMNRENVIAFIDEGHRTQYGLLAAQMKAIFKKAYFFALTGTPISKRGRDTYLEFSYPPTEPYLDRYFITDSLRDGFTVKIVYQPRLEKEVHLKRDELKSFIDSPFEELPEEIKEEVKEGVRKRLNLVKVRLENPERIAVIAEDIAEHFKENVDGRFKALVAAGSQKACTLYKNELDKYLPFEYSEIVMSYQTSSKSHDDPVFGKAAETRERYGGRDLDEIRKMIVERFKEEETPKILIVTDMLLTGFDAPILQVMYLDKPLKEHRLLQAVARTNRPYRDLKEAGLVLDYVGVLKEYQRALEMYSKEDLKGALFDYDSIRDEFITLIRDLLDIFDGLSVGYHRETLLKAIEIITTDNEREKRFVEEYKKLSKLFEILGPDEVKLEYFESYKWLSAVYTYYRKVVIHQPTYELDIQRYFEKTLQYIHRTTEIEKLDSELPAIEFDGNYLTALEEKVKDRKEKAANILFTLNRFILVDRHRNPIYESLVDKVDRLVEMWKEKNRDYAKIYTEGTRIVEAIDILSSRQKDLGFSDLEYSMLLALEERLGTENKLTREVNDLSGRLREFMFPGWINQITTTKEIEREVRRFARGLKKKYDLSLEEMNELHERLIENVRNFGIV